MKLYRVHLHHGWELEGELGHILNTRLSEIRFQHVVWAEQHSEAQKQIDQYNIFFKNSFSITILLLFRLNGILLFLGTNVYVLGPNDMPFGPNIKRRNQTHKYFSIDPMSIRKLKCPNRSRTRQSAYYHNAHVKIHFCINLFVVCTFYMEK